MPVELKKIFLCDHFQNHPERPSLIGLINNLKFKELPSKRPKIALVAFLEIDNKNGEAEKINFKLLDPDNNYIDVSVPPFEVPKERENGVILNLNITNLVFEKEGEYEFQILLDGELLGSKDIIVSEVS